MESRMTIDEHGTKRWLNENGECHRTDGPAVIYSSGTQCWYQNGKFHREDGPAAIWANCVEEWFQNGQLHRDNGPAVIWPNGSEWWLKDQNLSFTEWANELNLDSKQRLEMVIKWNPE